MHWIANRVGQAALTVLAVATLTFGLIHQIPGGPLDHLRVQLARQGADTEQINNLAQVYYSFRPDDPLYVQYFDYLSGAARGDFGESFLLQEPVVDVLAAALPWTIFVMSLALLFSFVLGIVLGAFMAYREGGRFDSVTTIGSMILNSTPFYVAAVFLVYVVGFQYGIFPTAGRYGAEVEPGLSLDFVVSALYHAALPIVSVVLTAFGGWAVAMRANSIQVLGSDYLRVARLRGLPTNRIAIQYVARNAILPLYTSLMIAIGFQFGGSVILEQIFSYPGVGYYMIKAIRAKDYPLLMGAFLLITVAVVVGILIADLTYGKIDPNAGGGADESY